MNDFFVHGAPTGPPTIARGGASRRRTEPLEYHEENGDPEGVTWWMQRITPSGSSFIKLQPGVRFLSPLAIVGCPFGARNARVKSFTALPEGVTYTSMKVAPSGPKASLPLIQGFVRRLTHPWLFSVAPLVLQKSAESSITESACQISSESQCISLILLLCASVVKCFRL